tara:strand:+ start:6117 stop:7427 length:1311 start_codon:yes stop_codon:yes gene_type:complete
MPNRNNFFKNKKILIYGLGKSGISAFNFLKKKNKVKVFDDDQIKNSNKILQKSFIKYNKIKEISFDFIIISPGIDIKNCKLKKLLTKNQSKIITDLDIFFYTYKDNKSITITGTNGKSTSVKLLYDILKNHKKDVRLTGNIGNPILMEKNIKSNTIFVIEASSYQIEYSKFIKTNYAAILNIKPDHLERHGNLKNYLKAKIKISENQTKNDFLFIEADNKLIKKELKMNRPKSNIIYVNKILANQKLRIKNKYFLTEGNLQNLSFILNISKKLRLKKKIIYQSINNFKSLKFRQEEIYKSKNLTIINDSKATSFSSSENVLKSLKNVYWILGGIPKKGDKFEMTKNDCKSFRAYIFGKHQYFFKKKLKGKLKYKTFKNLNVTIKKVYSDIIQNNEINNSKVILFSPAGASFDSFKNFEERGIIFNRLIKKLLIGKL